MTWPAKADAANEAQLIAVLQSAATPVEKEDACRRLKLLGTAKAVPALATLMADEHLYQAACDALETMPGEEAGAALRNALNTTSGKPKVGLIHALGERREPPAVPELASLLRDPDALVASASAKALGSIGGEASVRVLRQALASAAGPIRDAVVDALLLCATQMLAQGDRAAASSIFGQFGNRNEKEHVRVAAHTGLLAAFYSHYSHEFGPGLAYPALAGKDPAQQIAAFAAARDLKDRTAASTFTNLLTKASPAMQAALIGLLQQRGDVAATPAVATLARSDDSYVRSASLAALGTLGDATVIPLLAKAATSSNETEQKAARQALIELRRGDVAGAMVTQLVSAEDKVQVELIRALAARSETSAAPKLLELARTDTGSARRAALRAMEHFANNSHLAALVRLLERAKDETARAEIRNVFEALADRTAEGRKLEVAPIVNGFARADVATRIALLQVSALFPDAGLRAALRTALRDTDAQVRDAAARALCRSRDGELMPDLLELARNAAELNLRALALEGYVRLACDNERSKAPAQERVAMLKPALALATRAEEKRLVLAGLGGVPHPDALALAEQACADATVRAEAEVACLQISKSLLAAEPGQAEAALTRLAARAGNDSVRANAQAMVKQFNSGWLCAGPFRQDGKSGRELFDVAFAPEQPSPGAVKWRSAPALSDLMSVTAGDNCVVYLKTRVFTTATQPVILELGSDDGIKVWANGEVIHANNTDRGLVPGQDKAKAKLRQGWNDLLAKVTQNGGGCGMSLRITAADGSEIAGLRFDPRGESRP